MAKEIVSGIYCITNKLNNKKYIGSSLNIYDRWRVHKSGYDKKMGIVRAINKYGLKNFEFEILNISFPDQNILLALEQKYYDDYMKKYKLYNQIRPIINKLAGNKHWLGRKHTQKAKDLISQKNKGKKPAVQTIEAQLEVNRKPVLKYDLNGNFIREYKSITEAAQEIQINTRHISACCNKKRKSAKGFMFIFKTDEIKNKIEPYKRVCKCRKVVQYDLDNNFICIHNNINEAFKKTNIYNISSCCNGILKTAGGYKWKYAV